MIPERSLILFALACLCCSSGKAAAGQESPALYGTWRWVETVGDLLPARGTPETCQCARLLVLELGDTYRYFWPDSGGGSLLAQGRVSITNAADRPKSNKAFAEVRISFAPSFDSKRHSLPTGEVAGTLAGDTLLLVENVSRTPPSHLTRRFVREPNFTGKVPAPSTEVPTGRRPSGTQRDSLTIPPASTTPRPYEDPPVPVSWVESTAAQWLKGNTMTGDVQVKALVAADGRVRDAEVVSLGSEGSRSLVTTVKRWVFKPALMSRRPVACWVEIPFQAPR